MRGDIPDRKVVLSGAIDRRARGEPAPGMLAGIDGIRVGIEGIDQAELEGLYPCMSQYLPVVAPPGICSLPLLTLRSDQ